MRFLADEDVYFATVSWLRQEGHDVLTSYEAGLASLADPVVLAYAQENERILITRDSDYGALTFINRLSSMGAIYLRIGPETENQVHEQLLRLLAEHTEAELHHLFIVVEPSRHRIRRLP